LKAGEYRIIDEAKPSILAAHLVLENNLMPINFGQLSAADKASLISVSLLPIASLAGNAAADIIMVINIIIFFTVASGTVESYSQSWFLRLSFIFWGWTLFCSAVSAFPAHSFQDSLPWIRFPLYAFSLSCLLASRKIEYLRYFIGASVLGTLIELIFMLQEYLFIRGDAARLHGTFGKLTAGWYLACFGLIATLWCMEKLKANSNTNLYKFSTFFFTFLVSCGMLITGEIMNTLIFILTMFLYFLLQKTYSFRSIGLIIFCVTILFGVGLIESHLDPALQQRIFLSFTKRLPWMTSSDYYVPFKMGIETTLNNPWLGIGPKNSNAYCVELLNSGELQTTLDIDHCPWHPHNLYLQIAAETGCIGLMIFLTLVSLLLFYAGRHFKRTKYNENIPIVLIFVLFFPIQSYSQAFGQLKNFYFWSTLGFALALIRTQSQISTPDLEKPINSQKL
jgi:O-antigen ligase